MTVNKSLDSSPLTFEQWYAKPVVQPLTSSETLAWSDIGLHLSNIVATEEYVSGPESEHHFLIAHVRGATRLQTWFNDKFFDEHMTTGAFGLVPALHGSYGRWNGSSLSAFIRLSPSLINRLADETFRGDPARVQLLPLLNFHDPLLRHLTVELCNELQAPGPFGALFAESASHTIMLHLLRKYSTAVLIPQRSAARLTSRQVCVIDDYVESHLDQKISLTDLASLLFMSLSHFERTFRATLGCPPYRYVLERRIERAKYLLQRSNLSLHEVARQTGFANQSHFTRHFTGIVGVSPARFRDRLNY